MEKEQTHSGMATRTGESTETENLKGKEYTHGPTAPTLKGSSKMASRMDMVIGRKGPSRQEPQRTSTQVNTKMTKRAAKESSGGPVATSTKGSTETMREMATGR